MELFWAKKSKEGKNLTDNVIFYIARDKTDFFVYQIEANIYRGKFKHFNIKIIAIFCYYFVNRD